jgi:hypothetical protein
MLRSKVQGPKFNIPGFRFQIPEKKTCEVFDRIYRILAHTPDPQPLVLLWVSPPTPHVLSLSKGAPSGRLMFLLNSGF